MCTLDRIFIALAGVRKISSSIKLKIVAKSFSKSDAASGRLQLASSTTAAWRVKAASEKTRNCLVSLSGKNCISFRRNTDANGQSKANFLTCRNKRSIVEIQCFIGVSPSQRGCSQTAPGNPVARVVSDSFPEAFTSPIPALQL